MAEKRLIQLGLTDGKTGIDYLSEPAPGPLIERLQIAGRAGIVVFWLDLSSRFSCMDSRRSVQARVVIDNKEYVESTP